jgi:chromosome segregation ATPase
MLQREFDAEVSANESISETSQQEGQVLKLRLAELEEALEQAEAARTDESKGIAEKEAALTEKNSELEAMLSERDGELAQLKRESEAVAQEQKEAQETLLDKANLLETELRQALKAADEVVSEKEQQLKRLQREFDAEVSEKESISETSQQEGQVLKGRLAELEEALEQAEAARTDESKGIAEKEAALTEKNSELEAMLSQRENELAQIKAEQEIAEQERVSQKESFDLQIRELEASKEILSSEKQEKDELIATLENSEKGAAEALAALRLELDETVQKALESAEDSNKKLDQVESARAELMQRISEGRDISAEKEALESENEQLKADLKAVQVALDESESISEKISEDKRLAVESCSESEQKLAELQAKIGLLEKQSESVCTKLTEENSELVKELSEIGEKYKLILDERKKEEQEASERDARLKSSEEEKQRQVDEQRRENEQLHKQLETVKEEWQGESKKLESQVAQLEERENELIEQLKERERVISSKEEELQFNESIYAEKLTEFDGERAQLKDEMVSLRAGSDELSSRLEEKSRALIEQEEKSFSLRKEIAVLEHHAQEGAGDKGELWPDDHEALDQVRVEKKELLDEKELLAAQIDSLVEQNEELRQVVQEFVEASGERQEKEEGLDSLRAELEMVREQAASDVNAINEQLKQATEQAGRLEKALESAEEKIKEVDQRPSLLEGVEVVDNDIFLTIEESQRSPVLPVHSGSVNRPQGRNKSLWIVGTILILLALAGLAGFFTDQGRALFGLAQPVTEGEEVEVVLDHAAEYMDEKERELPVKQKKQGGEDFGSLLETISPRHDAVEEEGVEAVKPTVEGEELLAEDGEELLMEEGEDELF